ncbi:MAG: hypothetical protein Q9183_000764, partial [Haloplaca sp. 2 TL-2023]
EWKSRYARAKAQLGNLRTSSAPFQQGELQELGQARDLVKDDGLVLDVHVTQFQLSIDELLRGARAGAPDSLLVQVRQVVVAIRQITQDIGGTDGSKSGQETIKCKNKVSATANNLITATKNFAASKGLSPVSLLDAAASHLATAMVELIRTAKIRRSPAGQVEAEEEDNSIIAESPGAYYGLAHERMSYGGESIYSSPSPPRQPAALQYSVQGKHAKHEKKHSSGDVRMNGVKASANTKLGIGIREQDDGLEELRAFLEDQTEEIVQSIQSLHASVRDDTPPGVTKKHLDSVGSIVGRMVSETQHTIHGRGNRELGEQAGPVIEKLAACRRKIISASGTIDSIEHVQRWIQFRETLPPLGFDVARETKELVQRLDQLDGGA